MPNLSFDERSTHRITIRGAVQGVGFRPHVYAVATRHQLSGMVRNTGAGVEIILRARPDQLQGFLQELRATAPPASRIHHLEVGLAADEIPNGFQIIDSQAQSSPQTAMTPDLALCAACRDELFDPQQRRYRYPFINCTHCGPRYSILLGIPYDRAQTTMRDFDLCPACQSEYADPRDRRFHAQPNACPRCGPQLALWDAQGKVLATLADALKEAVTALAAGQIVAVKGLGGYHLMVAADQEDAVQRLRARKQRPHKPFAVMFPSMIAVEASAHVSALEAQLLQSAAAPIVLLSRRDSPPLAPHVAPGIPLIGAMLPYTPLHALLLHDFQRPLVATSGNLSDEPICYQEEQALTRLGRIADLFLVHNRPIARPVDDSIVRVMAGSPVLLRRARGYAPYPFALSSSPALAVGGQLKSTIALGVGDQAVVSQHLGDLDNEASVQAFEEAIAMLEKIYATSPSHMVCDLHPDYASTRYAERRGSHVLRVQHHHAHVASCMAEHGLNGEVCGIVWDGTGYGLDQTIWGGECLRATFARFERILHLRTFPLPGGDQAAREPRRAAMGLLYELNGPEAFAQAPAFSDTEREGIGHMLLRQVQSPRTSSAGRLFDAIASLLGLCQIASYEGQAAMQVEFAARDSAADRGYAVPDGDWEPMIRALLADQQSGVPTAVIAHSVHLALARCVLTMAQRVELPRVVLSGGCFQNARLLERALMELRQAGYQVYTQQTIPPNDGGLALGQLAVAAHVQKD